MAVTVRAPADSAGEQRRLCFPASRGEACLHQRIFGLRYGESLEPADEVAPGAAYGGKAGNEGDQSSSVGSAQHHKPPAGAQDRRNAELVHEIHEKIHRELQLENAHVQREDGVELPALPCHDFLWRPFADDTPARGAQSRYPAPHPPVDRHLHQRNEDKLRDDDAQHDDSHQWLDEDKISRDAEENSKLQCRFRNGLSGKSANGFGFGDQHGYFNAAAFGIALRMIRLADECAKIADGGFGHPAAEDIRHHFDQALRGCQRRITRG